MLKLKKMMSYFKTVGIWIKIKYKKKLNMYIRTKETQNYCKMMMLILNRGHIRPKSYTVLYNLFSFFLLPHRYAVKKNAILLIKNVHS